MTKRIIPCLDIQGGRVVKGAKFKDLVDVSDPVQLARSYNQQGADELVMYDISASSEGRGIALQLVRDIAAEVTIPFIVGGGIRSLQDIQSVLEAGADKVSITSAAVQNPSLIEEGAKEFGSSCIIAAIDAKEVGAGRWNVFIHGGRIDTGRDVLEWARELEGLGAGELVLNSIDTDGVREGYNIPLNESVAAAVKIPVIASGGAGTMEHFYDVLMAGANGALAASVFHFGVIGIRELKEYLEGRGVPVRRV
jgi:cyclase